MERAKRHAAGDTTALRAKPRNWQGADVDSAHGCSDIDEVLTRMDLSAPAKTMNTKMR